MRSATALALVLGVMVPFAAGAAPDVPASGAEASAYVTGDFRREFVVEYLVEFHAIPAKRSSVLTLSFFGGPHESDAITVGVVPSGRESHVFTSIARNGVSAFRDSGLDCNPSCRIRLQGDRNGIIAFIDERELGEWPRFWLRGSSPVIQVKTVLSEPGDYVRAELFPNVPRPPAVRCGSTPACAFTSRGIHADIDPGRELSFIGEYARRGPGDAPRPSPAATPTTAAHEHARRRAVSDSRGCTCAVLRYSTMLPYHECA